MPIMRGFLTDLGKYTAVFMKRNESSAMIISALVSLKLSVWGFLKKKKKRSCGSLNVIVSLGCFP